MVAGIFNWILLSLAAPFIAWYSLAQASPHLHGEPSHIAIIGLSVVFLISSLMIFTALKMKRLQAYGLAIAASILAIIISPGNLIGLPIGVWALVVLSQREVRAAFAQRRARAGGTPTADGGEGAFDALFAAAPRLSKTALAGAIWAGPFFLIIILSLGVITLWMTLSVSLLLPLLSPILVLLLATPIGVPILGYVALKQIRHSAGRLYGLGLALFDLWAFPLLAFHAVIAGLGIFAVRASAGGLGGLVALLFIVVACVVADFLVVRRVWRAVNQPPAGALPADRSNRAGPRTMLSVAALALMFCLGVCSFAFLLWSLPQRFESARARIHTRIFEADAKLVDELVPKPTRKPANMHVNPSRAPQTAEVTADVFAKVLADGANPPGLLDDQMREGDWWPKLAISSHYFRRGKVHGDGNVDGLLGIWRRKDVRQLRVEYNVLHGMNSEVLGATFVWEGSAPPPEAARAFFIPFSRTDGTARYLVIAIEVGDATENPSVERVRPKEEAYGICDVREHSGGPWIAKLPQGEIELVAISRHPSVGQPWWRPDGSAYTEKTFRNLGASGRPTATEIAREFVFRTQGLPNDASLPSWEFIPNANFACGGMDVNGKPAQGYYLLEACLPKSSDIVNIRVGVAMGPWKTVFEHLPVGNNSTSDGLGNAGWRVWLRDPIEMADGSTVVNVLYTGLGWEPRVIAVDDKGQEHTSSAQGGPSGPGNSAQLTATFANLPRRRIKEFRFQARPNHWVEFRNVALQPEQPSEARADDMQAYLNETQELVRQQHYAEALERFVWFHNHALERNPAMVGVRLSFALSYWKNLGDVYPPAKQAMVDMRDRKTRQLQENRGNAALFQDVAELNRTLGEDAKTVRLFQEIDKTSPALAAECWWFARQAVFKEKQYDLAKKYVKSPLQDYDAAKANHDLEIATQTRFGGPQLQHLKQMADDRFVEECLRLMELATFIGDKEAVQEIRKRAASVVNDPRLRENDIPRGNAVSPPKQPAETVGGERAAESDVPWGDWNASWSLRLRAAKATWISAELPEFTIDLRKRETGEPDAVRQTLHNWLLIVDERRFRLAIFTTSWEHKQLFELGTTRQGFIAFHFHRDRTGLHIRTGKNGEWINSYALDPVGKDGQVLSHPKPEEHFEWTPGKHVVRVAFPLMDPPPPGKREGYLAFSNPVEVQIQAAPPAVAVTTIIATGTIEPEEVVDVGAQVAGRIVSFGDDPRSKTDPSYKDKTIDYGSPVEEGTVLARIDDATYKTRVALEKAKCERAEAELAAAQAKAKEKTADPAMIAAEAAVAQAKAALKEAEINFDRTIIRSPVKGLVVVRRINVGRNVAPTNGPSLFLIAKGKAQVWAQVDEAEIGRIQNGMEANFTVEGLPNDVFKGTVAEIRRDATSSQNAATHTVVIAFENPGLKAMPYQTANVHFSIGPRAGTGQLQSFGPVIERTINHSGKDCLIDLDTGRLFTDSPEARKEGSKAALEWAEKNGIDAGGFVDTTNPGLIGFDMVVMPAPNERWDLANPRSLPSEFSVAKPGNPVFLTAKTLPATFTFKTREGGVGILQIIGFIENPKGVKVRYKLVQQVSQGPAEPAAATNGQSEKPVKPEGPVLVYEIDPASALAGVSALDRDKLLHAIDRRLNAGAEKLARVRKLDDGRIEVALLHRNDADRQRVERLLARPGTLEFRILASKRHDKGVIERAQKDQSKAEVLDASGKRLAWWAPVKAGEERSFANDPDTARRTRKADNREITEILVVTDPCNVTGAYLAKAGASDSGHGYPCLKFTLNDAGGKLFAKLTGDHLPDRATNFKYKLGIILDGELFSAPFIMARISNMGEISGSFTWEQLSDLADALNAGSLPVRIRLSQKPDAAAAAKHLKEIAVAMHHYYDENHHFPPAVLYGPDGKTPYSWRVALLPFLGQEPLYDQYHSDEPWDGPRNRKVLEKMPAVFCCFEEPAESTNASYFALVGPGTMFDGKRGTTMEQITDGTSSTIMLVEAKRDIPWTKPEDIPYDPDKPMPALGGCLEGGFHVAMADITVRFMPSTTSEKVLRALITKAGREIVENPGGAVAAAVDHLVHGTAAATSVGPDKPVKSVYLGGYIVTDATLEQLKGLSQLQSLNLANANVTDAGLDRLERATELQSLDLTFTKVTDAGLVHLKGLTKLQSLNLHGIGVTDAGLIHLEGLTHLRLLSLYGTKVTDAGLEHLKGFTQLQSLDLGATAVTGAGMEHLNGLPQLQSLELIWTGMTDAGLEHLKGLTKLQSLNLWGCNVTDAGLEHVAGLPQLQSLNLGRSKVTDAGLIRLKGLAKLRSLNLAETKVTDAGLEHLKGLTNLQSLGLWATKVTDTGKKALQKALPNCTIQ